MLPWLAWRLRPWLSPLPVRWLLMVPTLAVPLLSLLLLSSMLMWSALVCTVL